MARYVQSVPVMNSDPVESLRSFEARAGKDIGLSIGRRRLIDELLRLVRLSVRHSRRVRPFISPAASPAAVPGAA